MPLRSKNLKVNLGRLEHAVSGKLTKKAMAIAALELLRDSVMELPTTPILTGYLRGSGSVHVDGEFITSAHAEGLSPINGDPNEGPIDPGPKTKAVGTVGFNAEYATVQHERLGPRSEPSAGPKYLETAMLENADKYRAIIGNEIKKHLGKMFRG
jgi:hypothetical protein